MLGIENLDIVHQCCCPRHCKRPSKTWRLRVNSICQDGRYMDPSSAASVHLVAKNRFLVRALAALILMRKMMQGNASNFEDGAAFLDATKGQQIAVL